MKKFMENGFFTGINYWASKSATHMWSEYDAESVENDIRMLKEAGITILRVFPAWPDFQPLTAFCSNNCRNGNGVYEYGMNGEPCPDTEAGRAGVSEEACRCFEHFCDVAEKYDMQLNVALLTGHMSKANLIPPALVNLDLVTDPVAIKWEVKFIKYFVKRMKHKKAIVAWDLGNEVNALSSKNTQEAFGAWLHILADAVKAADHSRPILSGIGAFAVANGMSSLYDLGETCDWNTVHVYNIFMTPADPVNSMKSIMDALFKCQLSEDISKTPTFLQEFGATGYMNCTLKSEAEYYRASALSAFSHGYHGIMYWCSFDQGHITFAPYNWNNIGSDYGFFDKDMNAKPLVEENLRIKGLLEVTGGTLPKYKRNCTIVIPREDGGKDFEPLRAAYMLAERVGLDAGFAYALDKMPESELYIIPSVKSNNAINYTRLLEILQHVEEGAALYISLDKALFRKINTFSGTSIDNMIQVPKNKVMQYKEESMPITVPAQYDIVPETCEVLATDEEGQPIFVKNRYGKGWIYVMFAPLERYLSDRTGAFYEDTTPNYENIYKELKRNVKNTRIAALDSRYILHTEHVVDENTTYIFAINYSNKERTAGLQVKAGYELKVLWGNSFDGEEIKLAPCDGILIEARKTE